jgi:hypothetical protein
VAIATSLPLAPAGPRRGVDGDVAMSMHMARGRPQSVALTDDEEPVPTRGAWDQASEAGTWAVRSCP